MVDQLRTLLRHPDVIARTYREIAKCGEAGPNPAALAHLALVLTQAACPGSLAAGARPSASGPAGVTSLASRPPP